MSPSDPAQGANVAAGAVLVAEYRCPPGVVRCKAPEVYKPTFSGNTIYEFMNFETWYQAVSEPENRVRAMTKKRQRQIAGAWLKELRESAGLSQRELAASVGAKYYSFIAQVECGFVRLPVASMRNWANALGIPATRFARQLLSYYDPELFRLLFTAEGAVRRR
jgi:hypothetical protein